MPDSRSEPRHLWAQTSFREGVHYRVLDSGCWEWLGAKDQTGYGLCSKTAGERRAARAVFAETRGPIPKGHHIHHRCKTVACIRPDHLEMLTSRQHFLVHLLHERTGLSIDDVRAARALRADPDLTAADVAERFGVHEITVYEWWSSGHWADMLGEPAPQPVRECVKCGTEFSEKKRSAKFCSVSCRQSYNQMRRRRIRRGLDPNDLSDLRIAHAWRKAGPDV